MNIHRLNYFFHLAPDGYTCTMIPVFYCEDWTAKEDSPQEGFTGLTTPHFAEGVQL